MKLAMDTETLKTIVKESVREVIDDEQVAIEDVMAEWKQQQYVQ